MAIKQESKIITVILAVLIILFVISASISVPILFRSFYYAHIDWLDIPENTGYAEEEIRIAYDEMMDYCMGKTDNFNTGKLSWTEEGREHFYDCSVLFSLDLALLVFSAVWIIAFLIFMAVGLQQMKFGSDPPTIGREKGGRARISGSAGVKKYLPARILGRGPMFISGSVMIIVFAVLGVIAAMDFDGFFVKFHHAFFPGKDNWIFDPAKDEIIKILPEEFFRNCGILIVSLIVIASVVLIIADIFLKKSRIRKMKTQNAQK